MLLTEKLESAHTTIINGITRTKQNALNFVVFLKNIDKMFPSPPYHNKEEERARVKKIVSRFATGDISLQQGRYLTQADIEQKKDSLSSYDFMARV